jgi:hypothetical protein
VALRKAGQHALAHAEARRLGWQPVQISRLVEGQKSFFRVSWRDRLPNADASEMVLFRDPAWGFV